MAKNDSNLIRLCGLWKGKSNSGTPYLSGKLGNARIFIFAIREKRSDKSPDYALCIAPAEPRGDNGRADETEGRSERL